MRAQLNDAEAVAKEASANKKERVFEITSLERKVDHQVNLLRALVDGCECLTGTTRS